MSKQLGKLYRKTELHFQNKKWDEAIAILTAEDGTGRQRLNGLRAPSLIYG
ncbi:MAG: hypothetical protein OXU40_05115 [Nitrospira sp.]|nr:hypothetical protein [Nitrospira sp.]